VGSNPRSGEHENYAIDMCCFPSKQEALGSKNKCYLARNPDDVSK
jgi:hypothetical protein